MLKETHDTIVALSTPLGVGAICIVRMSGSGAIAVADKLFVSNKGKLPSSFEARKLELGIISYNAQIGYEILGKTGYKISFYDLIKIFAILRVENISISISIFSKILV